MNRKSHAPPLIVAALALLAPLAGCASGPASGGSPSGAPPSPTPTAPAPAGGAAEVECEDATAEPTTTQELEDALDAAQPGDVIALQPGTYEGEFVASAQGTQDAPITLCGPEDAILDGGAVDGGYVLHLDGVSHWIVQGFTVRNGQKGIMADATTHTTIRGITVTHIGDEGIHLRAASTDNHVVGNTVGDTGLRKPKFGEGIYIGSAESNWCDITGCEPDRSDRNVIEGNTISGTTSESVDIKEGTSAGVLRGNTFDGSAITDADSWVDVKGNGWRIEGNEGTSSPGDGFQTHEILDGWGTDNVFAGNVANLEGPGDGVAFAFEPERGNVLLCDNEVSGDRELSNVECRE
ncbi:right-handed parallel beta-helix repeat-containing protein [Microbacterium immunditiarum]|uniref:Right handed beta helix domain-containing protein n=1 Tax=Microbacterium immunditiarum TaxID=337480 RepID=A0A7Y9KL46_9MICO|nr:right-handed parallel beta-helix repeat-containing protein [Microbacterium immunditiarum]NYE19868.1 hypothetical protein [Microbacterium immunditiarum]